SEVTKVPGAAPRFARGRLQPGVDGGWGSGDLRLPRRGRVQLVGGRLGAQQIADEVVPTAPDHIRLVAEVVAAVGERQEVKVLVGPNQLVHQQQRVVGRDVVVRRAVGDQQLAAQALGQVLVRLVVVVGGAV